MKNFTLFLALCFGLSACRQQDKKTEAQKAKEEIESAIEGCVKANAQILGNLVDHQSFCGCLIPKLYAEFQDHPDKKKLLVEGNWDELSKDRKGTAINYYEDCMAQSPTADSSARLTFNPEMLSNMKRKMKQELIKTELAETNDLDQYCDCILTSLQAEFTAQEVMKGNFNQTEKYQKVVERCAAASKKK